MRLSAALVSAAAFGAVLVPAATAHASVPAKYANCTNLHRTYPHGVGRATARDRVATGGRPVTTWRRDTAAYNLAIRYNRGLDRDRDFVACEKR
jgi:hypothetical protein